MHFIYLNNLIFANLFQISKRSSFACMFPVVFFRLRVSTSWSSTNFLSTYSNNYCVKVVEIQNLFQNSSICDSRNYFCTIKVIHILSLDSICFQWLTFSKDTIFPHRSITACLRLDIYAKKQLWQINYDCISVSMELPMMRTNDTMRMTDTAIETSTVSTAESRQSSITESVTEMTEIVTAQTSEINGAETNERAEEVEDITEILGIISEETTPIK